MGNKGETVEEDTTAETPEIAETTKVKVTSSSIGDLFNNSEKASKVCEIEFPSCKLLFNLAQSTKATKEKHIVPNKETKPAPKSTSKTTPKPTAKSAPKPKTESTPKTPKHAEQKRHNKLDAKDKPKVFKIARSDNHN